MFRIKKPFSLFPAAQVLGGENLSQTVTQVEQGEKRRSVGMCLSDKKTAHRAFNVVTAVLRISGYLDFSPPLGLCAFLFCLFCCEALATGPSFLFR